MCAVQQNLEPDHERSWLVVRDGLANRPSAVDRLWVHLGARRISYRHRDHQRYIKVLRFPGHIRRLRPPPATMKQAWRLRVPGREAEGWTATGRRRRRSNREDSANPRN